jgi:hypothetical protein
MSGCCLYGTIYIVVSVPVTGDEVHVRTKYNATVVHFNGAARDIESLFNVNVAGVR